MAKGFLDSFFDAAPHLEYFSNLSSSALKRHLLKWHLTLSEQSLCGSFLLRSGGPKGGHLEGGHLKMGFRSYNWSFLAYSWGCLLTVH